MEGERYDVAIIGAGPAGLACAVESLKAGLTTVIFDRGCLTSSIYRFPSQMTFFTTADLLEIGDIPFTTPHAKPTRAEALVYYRRVAEHYEVEMRAFEDVREVVAHGDYFELTTERALLGPSSVTSRAVVVATGYYDNPVLLGVPGEDLPKVSHYYTDPHPYYRRDVLVVGGKNSAAIAALELYRSGARVTLVHRGARLGRIKYWILPDIENRIAEEAFPAHFKTEVVEIALDHVLLRTRSDEGERLFRVANDFVFALTGYEPDVGFLVRAGATADAATLRPMINPDTFETNVPGLYVAGSIVAGRETDRLFIENGRFHGSVIVQHIMERRADNMC